MDVGEVPPPITPDHNPHDIPVRPETTICLGADTRAQSIMGSCCWPLLLDRQHASLLRLRAADHT